MTSTLNFQINNEAEFSRIITSRSQLEKIVTGMQFLEGPVWSHEEGGYLIFSDIPAARLSRWDPEQGVTLYRNTHCNGNTRDREGRLLTCGDADRVLTRTEKDGSIRILADRYDGKRLNSPNDVVVKRDGSIWFTDPTYGMPEGAIKEQPGCYVYRLDPEAGNLRPVAEDFHMPNGLCFSPDEKLLYVADSGDPRHIRVFMVERGDVLSGGKVFCTIDNGVPDGIRCDSEGRLYSTAGDGVHIFSPDGALIGKILIPEVTANLCFGGSQRRTLFITASTSLYRIEVESTG